MYLSVCMATIIATLHATLSGSCHFSSFFINISWNHVVKRKCNAASVLSAHTFKYFILARTIITMKVTNHFSKSDLLTGFWSTHHLQQYLINGRFRCLFRCRFDSHQLNCVYFAICKLQACF